MRLIDADRLKRVLIAFFTGAHLELPHISKVIDFLDTAPTIDAVPVRHGHWVTKKTAAGSTYTVCSRCNTSVKYNDEYGTVVMNLRGANYCPNCGAKMDEVSE